MLERALLNKCKQLHLARAQGDSWAVAHDCMHCSIACILGGSKAVPMTLVKQVINILLVLLLGLLRMLCTSGAHVKLYSTRQPASEELQQECDEASLGADDNDRLLETVINKLKEH